MATVVHFDTAELDALGRAIAGLPGHIKTKAFASAMRRMRDMARTRVVRRSAERTELPTGLVRALTTARFNAGSSTIEVVEKSGWVPVYRLGAKQTPEGVQTAKHGNFRSAFLAEMSSGHKGVMSRRGSHRLPIRELFGPNPAHDITNNPDEYIKVLAEVIEEHLAPRVLHEIERLLPG